MSARGRRTSASRPRGRSFSASLCRREWGSSPLPFFFYLPPPHPPQRLRKEGPAVLAVVALLAHDELVVVALELQGRLHLQVAQRPAAVLVVQVLPARLQE